MSEIPSATDATQSHPSMAKPAAEAKPRSRRGERQRGEEERARRMCDNTGGATAETPAQRYATCPGSRRPAATRDTGLKHPPFPPHPPEVCSWLPRAKAADFSLRQLLATPLPPAFRTASPRAWPRMRSTDLVLSAGYLPRSAGTESAGAPPGRPCGPWRNGRFFITKTGSGSASAPSARPHCLPPRWAPMDNSRTPLCR